MSNTLNTKKLARIQGIILQISNLDTQVSQIQDLADCIANGRTVDISMESVMLEQAGVKTKVNKNGSTVMEVQVTERGRPSLFGIPLGSIFDPSEDYKTQSKVQPHNKVSLQISEGISLRVLALVLEDKLSQKQKLVVKLNKLGVK